MQNEMGITNIKFNSVNMMRNTFFHRVLSPGGALRNIGKLRCLLALVLGLLSAECAYAVQGTEFIAPPKYNLTDRFSVSHFSGDVSPGVDTVAIGGERGLSHSISARANLFEYPGNRGYTDKYAAALRYKEIGREVVVQLGGQVYDVLWVMSATALGDTADFLVMRNGNYAFGGMNYTSNYYYEAIGDKRHTLTIEGGNRVWTKPDGTQVFFGVAVSNAAGAGASASKVVYPNGFTLYLHYGTGVTTNTGFQLKFDYINDDPGLEPAKQNATFPANSIVPTVTQSNQAQWWYKNPKYVHGINRAIEYCDESTTEPCDLEEVWPKATFNWPGGMPRAIFIDETVVTIENAAGGKAKLHYEAYDAARLHVDDPGSIIDGEIAGVHMAPRLAAYTAPGATQHTAQYTYKNKIATMNTGNGSAPYINTRQGETKTADGIMGTAGYHHNPGQWGEIFHVGAGISAGVSTVLPGTLQEITVDSELRISSFEATYRNFPIVVQNFNGPNKRYEYLCHCQPHFDFS
jgi:hypothetical protein